MREEELPDRHVIACNVTEGSSAVPQGALAYVVRLNPGGGHDRIPLLIRSRGGRWIEKWEAIDHLSNFRVKTLPPEHPRYGDPLWDYDVESGLAELRGAQGRRAGTHDDEGTGR